MKKTNKSSSKKSKTFPQPLQEGLEDFASEYFQMRFEGLKNDQKSQTLGKFFLREILAQSIDGLGVTEIDDNWLDIAGDLGVDFLYKRGNDVLILQSKYRGPHGSVTRADIDQTLNILETLKNVDPGKDLRELVDRSEDIDWDKDSFTVYFLCSCPVTPGLKRHFNARNQSHRKGEIFASFHLVDLPELVKLYKLELNTAESLPDCVTLDVVRPDGSRNCVIIKEPREMHLFVTSGTSLAKAYKDHQQALFNYNVRFTLGLTKVNEGIIKTAQDKPEAFVIYNNGISCIAEKADLIDTGSRMECRRLQVINGAQTVSSLAGGRVSKGNLAKLGVPVKLTIVEDLKHPTDDELAFVEEIVRSSNTQNPTKFADTRSNDRLHESLKRFFQREKFNGKTVEYRPKRIRKDASQEKSIYKIYLEDFCKTLYAFLYNPVDFTSDSRFLFSIEINEPKNLKGGYLKLFGEDGELPLSLPREKYQQFAAIWWICRFVQKALRDDRGDLLKSDKKDEKARDQAQEDHAALERGYFVYSAMRMLIQQKGYLNDLEDYASPKWIEQKGSSHQFKYIKKYYQLAKSMVIKSHREVLGKGKTHRQWLSSPDTVRSIESFIGFVDIESLPDLTDL